MMVVDGRQWCQTVSGGSCGGDIGHGDDDYDESYNYHYNYYNSDFVNVPLP